MAVTTANNWSEFADWVESIQSARQRLAEKAGLTVCQPVFRGQGDDKWNLSTTLERQYPESLDMRSYYEAIWGARPTIESHTGASWNIPNPDEISKWLDGKDLVQAADLPACEYLVYLRHHGFPSPLLDWSASPYVAAHFAASSCSPHAERFAIYAFIEFASGMKMVNAKLPYIETLGPYIRTHRRHFQQQARYTFCVAKSNGAWRFEPHDHALQFDENASYPQDLIWKITLPGTERRKVLGHLDQFNLNSYSLFGSEESLMETVAFRELRSDP